MSTTPKRPGTDTELDEETVRILDERLATFEETLKTARPADEVVAELRKKYQRPSPQ